MQTAGDFLDLFAGDAETHAIVNVFEAISNPRKFLSAARAAAPGKARWLPLSRPSPRRRRTRPATQYGALSGPIALSTLLCAVLAS